MARNDERRRQREQTERGLRELEDADWDETSEVVASVAARTAVKIAQHLSAPDSDSESPKKTAWHRTPVAKAGGVLAVLAALTALIEMIRQLVEVLKK